MIDLKSIQSLKSEKNNFFRFKKFNPQTYLITNDIGKYYFLSTEDFGLFLRGEIPQGVTYKELQEKGFIKSADYENFMAFKFLQKNYFVGYGPSLHIIVTTLRCNHACQYCHASVAKEDDVRFDMSLETAKKVVDTIFYTNSKNITIEFQGGESLLNFEVIQYIIEYAREKAFHLNKNLYFALVSNITLLDAEKLQYLVESGVSISTSLDGDEELHNSNRTYKHGNSYKEVTEKIQEIHTAFRKNKRQDTVGVLLTVTKKTLTKHREIVDAYRKVGLDGIYLRPLNPYGFAEKQIETLGYNAGEFIDFYRKSLDYIIDINLKGTLFREQYACIFLHKILTDSDPNFLDSRSPCGACIGQVAYNYDGRIFSCDEGRMFDRMGDSIFQIGEVSEDGKETYTQIMNSDVTKVMVQASTLDGLPRYNEHVYKPYLGVCPISSYKATGNIVPQFSQDERTKIDIGILDYLFEKIQDPQIKKIFENWIQEKTVLDTLAC